MRFAVLDWARLVPGTAHTQQYEVIGDKAWNGEPITMLKKRTDHGIYISLTGGNMAISLKGGIPKI
jgi:hypothetical protein